MEKDLTKFTVKSSKNNFISAAFVLNKLREMATLNVSGLVRWAFPDLSAVCDTHIYDDVICTHCSPKLGSMPEPSCH